jgi:hypothetical protein
MMNLSGDENDVEDSSLAPDEIRRLPVIGVGQFGGSVCEGLAVYR